jgi:hypothetical protein
MKTVSRRDWIQLALAPATLAGAQQADLPPATSRVYPGPDGKLVFIADEQGNTIADFSHAGYRGGGAPIPSVPIKETVWPVAGDNTANLQAAVDRVSALPLDTHGFRGVVLIKMGYYKMATPLKILTALMGSPAGMLSIAWRTEYSASHIVRAIVLAFWSGLWPAYSCQDRGCVRSGHEGRNQANRLG